MVGDTAADLVIVGFGGAGAAAALRATELGASVILIEKQAEFQHTPSTMMSGGHVMCVNDIDHATVYLDRCAGGLVPTTVSRAWASKAAGLSMWLDAQGTNLNLQRSYGAEHPSFEGAAAIDVCVQARRKDGQLIELSAPSSLAQAQGAAPSLDSEIARGPQLFGALYSAVARRTADVLWDSPARQLVVDGDRVVGVRLDDDREVRGRHGVILTTGGYEFDELMKLNYLKAPGIHFYGNPGNTGDGVRMAQAVGADLWHMNLLIGSGIGHFSLPDGTALNFSLSLGNGVWLDSRGRRFTNEARQMLGLHDVYNELLVYDTEAEEYPRIPSYWFFDERTVASGALCKRGVVEVGLYEWSADNSREIEAGWIHVGDTVEDAASQAGIADPHQASSTISQFNEICSTGDDPLGRPPALLTPLEGPPYYCVALYPGGSNTCGGPRRNHHAQVVNPFGTPIPGLFAAGELGAAYGQLYPAGGCNLSDAFCFGQIAVESALSGGAHDE